MPHSSHPITKSLQLSFFYFLSSFFFLFFMFSFFFQFLFSKITFFLLEEKEKRQSTVSLVANWIPLRRLEWILSKVQTKNRETERQRDRERANQRDWEPRNEQGSEL
jgi:hypothetical protein